METTLRHVLQDDVVDKELAFPLKLDGGMAFGSSGLLTQQADRYWKAEICTHHQPDLYFQD